MSPEPVEFLEAFNVQESKLEGFFWNMLNVLQAMVIAIAAVGGIGILALPFILSIGVTP